MVANLISHQNVKEVDFGCFETIMILGTKMPDHIKNGFQVS